MWAPNTQAVVAVLFFGGLLAVCHVASLHVNAGGSIG